MNKFYNSVKWRKLSKLFMQSKYYVCERCGGVGEIAHHKIHLDRFNVHDVSIAYGFDNLECLCAACHLAEHRSVGSATAAGLGFDSAGNLIKL
jgi:5-methylcytosine-specific restriction endonuclease McrA